MAIVWLDFIPASEANAKVQKGHQVGSILQADTDINWLNFIAGSIPAKGGQRYKVPLHGYGAA